MFSLKKALLHEHSRRQMEYIAKQIANDKNIFDEAMTLFFANEKVVSQRVAWVIRLCSETYPELITPYVQKLIRHLSNQTHDAVKRNTLVMLEKVTIPKNKHGELFDVCFNLFSDKSQAIAIRVISMTILSSIALTEPELKRELRTIIEEELPFAKPAYLARARKVLKALS